LIVEFLATQVTDRTEDLIPSEVLHTSC